MGARTAGRTAVLMIVLCAGGVAAHPAQGAGALAVGTTRVSVRTGGTQANGVTYESAISADGRYVAFTSSASNLVAGDTNDDEDVFVRDRLTGATTRVSVRTGGAQADDRSADGVAISADGRYVAFLSDAALVGDDTNGDRDVYVRDRVAATTTRVSVRTGGTQANDHSRYGSSISATGRYVVFTSVASNLVSGDTNGTGDIFVRDRVAGTTARVSVRTGGAQSEGLAGSPVITPDGRYVAFESGAGDLVAGDTNPAQDVFVRDRVVGTTSLVSLRTGTQANEGSFGPAISSDGRYVAFATAASNLVYADTNGKADVFVRDRVAAATTRMSLSGAGAQADDFSGAPTISADGRYVCFTSAATNLVTGDTNELPDAFVRQRS